MNNARLRPISLFLLGLPAAYFLTSCLSSLHSGTLPFLLLSLLTQLACGTCAVLILRKKAIPWMTLPALFPALGLAAAALVLSLQFPGLFDRRILFMEATQAVPFALLAFVSATAALSLTRWIERRGWLASLEASALYRFTETHLPGLVLAAIFGLTYFTLAQSLNFAGFRTLDLYFDTDISEWIARLTAASPTDTVPPIRAVHPAVLLFLRPAVWLLSLPLNGDRLQAVFLLSALAGAGCVFLAWVVVRRVSNTAYALLMASLLGAGASHLLLGSMLETYIFSALALLAFVWLIQTERTALRWTVPAGVLIFGITVTNLAQACLLYFLKAPRLKRILAFVVLVVVSTLALNVIQVRVFPSAAAAYNPSNLLAENKYRANLSEAGWRLRGRVNLIARAVLLYGVVAPKPFVLTEELGTPFPNFRTFQITPGNFAVAGYQGLGDVTAKAWMALLALALLLLVVEFLRAPTQVPFQFGLLLCLGFSFVLHTLYGDDPMLYSPNWAYAVTLFAAFSLRPWADKRWFQVVLIVFLGMVIYTNLGLVRQILAVSLPYYGK